MVLLLLFLFTHKGRELQVHVAHFQCYSANNGRTESVALNQHALIQMYEQFARS